jgi:hypothetical protein
MIMVSASQMALDGTVLDGRPIKVNFANKKSGADVRLILAQPTMCLIGVYI